MAHMQDYPLSIKREGGVVTKISKKSYIISIGNQIKEELYYKRYHNRERGREGENYTRDELAWWLRCSTDNKRIEVRVFL